MHRMGTKGSTNVPLSSYCPCFLFSYNDVVQNNKESMTFIFLLFIDLEIEIEYLKSSDYKNILHPSEYFYTFKELIEWKPFK